MKSTAEKKRKSEKLTTLEWSLFRQSLLTFDTRDDAAAFFGIGHVDTLSNIRDKGKGRPDTIKKIRDKLQELQSIVATEDESS